MFLVVGSLSRTCEAQQTQSEQMKMATAWKTWRNVMKRTPLPQKTGCFNASYPNTTWQKATCKKAPDIPYFPANGSRPYTVGGGNDALASAPDISSATGSFAKFTGLTSANGYSLQLNTNTFQTTACNGAADPSVCLGWEQFIFSEPSSTVFIQYWLIDWGQACPFGWLAYNGSCFINSGAVSIPAQSLSDLPYLQLSGELQAARILPCWVQKAAFMRSRRPTAGSIWNSIGTLLSMVSSETVEAPESPLIAEPP